jgi:hypothetical protein
MKLRPINVRDASYPSALIVRSAVDSVKCNPLCVDWIATRYSDHAILMLPNFQIQKRPAKTNRPMGIIILFPSLIDTL